MYLKGCGWDMCYRREGEENKVQAIKHVKGFERDPIDGDGGPALDEYWAAKPF
jgi:uncharacterized protein YjlB